MRGVKFASCRRNANIVTSIVALVFGLYACQTEVRQQATKLVAIGQAIDPALPPEMRQPHVHAMAKLPLSDKALISTRDLCVQAHQALVDAELSHKRAMNMVATQGHSELTAVQAQRLEKEISSSNAQLTKAKDKLPGCEDQLRQLRIKYEQ